MMQSWPPRSRAAPIPSPSWTRSISGSKPARSSSRARSRTSSSLSSMSRTRRGLGIGLAVPPGTGLRLDVPEGEADGRALPHRAFRPDAATMAVDDSGHDGEADARSVELLGRVQALEGREEPVGVSHVEAGAVVA